MLPVVFTLVAVSSWTYGGFLAKPSSAPTPPPSPTVPAGSPLNGPADPATSAVVVPPVVPLEAPSNPPAPTPTGEDAAKAPTEPRRYQLVDFTGQVWEHTDPAWLQEFVRDRNRQLAGIPR